MTRPEAIDIFTTKSAWIGDRQVHQMDLKVEQEMIDVGPSESRVPDPYWTYTDRKGHWHAWADDGTCPTLIKSVGPDGEEIWYACKICNQTIRPNFKTKYNDQPIPGQKSWRVEAIMTKLPIPAPGSQHVIRLFAGDTIAFGIAAVMSVAYEPGQAKVIMSGVGALAYRHDQDA